MGEELGEFGLGAAGDGPFEVGWEVGGYVLGCVFACVAFFGVSYFVSIYLGRDFFDGIVTAYRMRQRRPSRTCGRVVRLPF